MILTRRNLLVGASAATFAPSVAWADTAEKLNPRSIAVGDVGPRSATLWMRGRRNGRMVVQIADNPDFRDAREEYGPVTGADVDYTARLEVKDLPWNQQVYWRATLEQAGDRAEWMNGSFRTVGPDRDIRFIWGGDTGGQGYGIDESRGGMRIFEAIRQLKPDFLLHCGDLAYSDQPFKERLSLPGGGTWNNLVTPETTKVSETLEELRGRFRYNHIDDNFRNMLTEVPILHMWDDHEVKNNYWPGMTFVDTRYKTGNVDAIRGPMKRAFLEYTPIIGQSIYRKVHYGPLLDVFMLDVRSDRGPNSKNKQEVYGFDTEWMGPWQRDWLKRELRDSKATWKVIACDMPLGIRGGPDKRKSDNATNGDGPPLGRELEVADVLKSIKDNGVQNVLWLTADLHYATANRYDPDKAEFKEFSPFWELMAGPLHAGTGKLHRLDNTFGPEMEWASIDEDTPRHAPPSDGLQFFGLVEIDKKSAELTVRFYNQDSKELHKLRISPKGT